MPRPQEFERQHVVEEAKQAFWQDGYQTTAISDLEERTGVNRSSIYHAFGSKRELFGVALDSYVEDVIDPILAPMEHDPPALEAITTFFSAVKGIVSEEQGQRRRGCLMVNTIAELSPKDEDAATRAVAFQDRLRRAFARVLEGAAARGEIHRASVSRRARMLAATTFGVWLSARIDPADAARLCDEAASEVVDWQS